MYRVYNIEKKKWVKDNIFLAQNEDIYILKKSFFGRNKLVPVSDENYVIHRDIELYDKNDALVYEGDYIKAQVAEDKIVTGLVTHAYELSSYIILCLGSGEYYNLGSEVCEYIEVIGNVFDGYDEGLENGNESLQESKV